MHAVSGDSVPSGLLAVDRADRILDANAVILSWLGAQTSDLVGRLLGEVIHEPGSSGPESADHLVGLAGLTLADGSDLPVFVSRGDPDEHGERLVAVFDATVQRAYRERLQVRYGLVERTQKRLELVIAASIAFAETTSETELAQVLAATTAEAYAAEESVVFLTDESMALRQVAGTNPFAEMDSLGFLSGRAAQLRTVIKISGLAEAAAMAPMIADAFRQTGVQSVIIAPIHQGDQQLGILAAFFRHPRTFDEQASPLADALAGQAARAVSALRLQRKLEHAAMHDDTTGLPNRRLLEEKMDDSRTRDSLLAVLFVDLDGFKNVNDQLGHEAGDEVLREVALRLQAAVREHDVVARYGGDEFVIVCDVPHEAAAVELAERIRTAIRAPYAMLPATLPIGASIGLSLTTGESAHVRTDGLVRAADRAMYSAKYAGGDRVVLAES